MYVAFILGTAANLYGQLGADPISGGAGWVGAGLLGLVLGWLLILHLPAKDKQLKELQDARDNQVKEIIDGHNTLTRDLVAQMRTVAEGKDKQLADIVNKKWEIIQALTRDYKEGLKEVAAHCEVELSRLTQYWQSHMGQLTQAIQDLAERVNGGK